MGNANIELKEGDIVKLRYGYTRNHIDFKKCVPYNFKRLGKIVTIVGNRGNGSDGYIIIKWDNNQKITYDLIYSPFSNYFWIPALNFQFKKTNRKRGEYTQKLIKVLQDSVQKIEDEIFQESMDTFFKEKENNA